jgi:DNA-binding LytR/AlgR family response regulator
MLRIAVCDDAQSCLHDVRRLLDEYGAAHGIELVATAFSLPLDLLERVESGAEFDLYLLDVYMPGMTGIELAGQLRHIGIEAPVVFLTTSKEHALEAFGAGAAGYLVKPFEREGFFRTLDAVTSHSESERRRNVLLKVDGEVRSIAVRDILYCEAHRNDQCISLADGSDVRLRMTTGELFALLAPSGSFARCGAAYILNLAKLRRLNPKSALMADGAEIPVPRDAYAELKTAYYDFYSER